MGWTFSPDEFAHLWRETELDRHPYPIQILETPKTETDAAALHAELAARFTQGADPDLSACLRILAEPHTRIVAVGGGHGPRSETRILAGVIYDRAVLAVQEPGRQPGYGGRVKLAIGHSAKLGGRIAGLLPATPAGREPARVAPADNVRDADAAERSANGGPIRRLLSRPHSAEGHIRIEPRLDRPQPPPPVHYTWIDVEGDGRYLLKAGESVHIVPATVEQLAAQLQKRVPVQAR